MGCVLEQYPAAAWFFSKSVIVVHLLEGQSTVAVSGCSNLGKDYTLLLPAFGTHTLMYVPASILTAGQPALTPTHPPTHPVLLLLCRQPPVKTQLVIEIDGQAVGEPQSVDIVLGKGDMPRIANVRSSTCTEAACWAVLLTHPHTLVIMLPMVTCHVQGLV